MQQKSKAKQNRKTEKDQPISTPCRMIRLGSKQPCTLRMTHYFSNWAKRLNDKNPYMIYSHTYKWKLWSENCKTLFSYNHYKTYTKESI